MEELDNKDCLFKWGRKRGSNIKKDSQFYDSFILDGVHYSLYDNVYLFKDGDDPYIGKILKIWEKDGGAKKVKILWFFHSSEISNYIGGYEPLDNELFLASGDGRGLSDINPLEAISGKCSVTCISKDKRNTQPSKDELENSDFVFSRTFDVEKHVICDIFPDEIANIKVEFLLNKNDRGLSGKTKGGSSKRLLHPEGIASDENKDKNGGRSDPLLNIESFQGREDDGINSAKCVDEASSAKHKRESHLCSDKPSTQCVDEKVTSAKHKAKSDLCGDKPSTQRADEKVTSAKHKANSDLCGDKPSTQRVDEKVTSAKHKAKSDLCGDKPSTQRVDEKVTSAKHKAESYLCGDKPSTQRVDEKVTSAKHKAESDLCGDKPSTQRVDEKVTSAKHKAESDLCGAKPSTECVDEKVTSAKQSHLKVPFVDTAISSKNSTPVEGQIIEVTRKPDVERSKWFKGPSWEERIPKANNQGTLMFLQFFDQSITSANIEDIIYSTFQHSCSARVLPAIPSYRNPHYGQAYVIFKTQEAAIETIKRINTGCLLLSDGSSFFASKGMLELPPKAAKFPGHMAVDSKKPYREEMRNAVSTSHCSQPNTIEYQMALEWILLQEKTAMRFEKLHEIHGEELKKVKKNLKVI